LAEIGILSALLNWRWWYNIHNIHDCLPSGHASMQCTCSSAVASPSESIC